MDDGPFLGARGPFPTPNPSVGVVVSVPALTNASHGTPTADGCTGASVDTSVGNGTLYWAVLTNGGTATNAQIKAGSGGNIVAGASGRQSVSGTGTQIISNITGLTGATTYLIVYLQTSAGGADSAQASIALTTSGGYSPEATQFFARLSTPPSTARKNLYAACIDSLVPSGVWAKADALYTFVSESNGDTDTALTSLIQSTGKMVIEGTGVTFTATGGFVTGASGFIDNPTLVLSQYTQNSASLGAWFIGVNDATQVFGDNSTTFTSYVIGSFADGNSYAGLNLASDTDAGTPNALPGFILGVRPDASTMKRYFNGSLQASFAENSAPFNDFFYIQSDQPVLAGYIGAALDATEQLALYNAVHTFLQATAGVP